MVQQFPWITIRVSILLTLLIGGALFADEQLPYRVVNRSRLADSEVYIAVVGITDGHVWVDCKTGEVKPMQQSDNSIQGPIYEGNTGPGLDGKYANCFTRLSDIPNRTIPIPKIAGTRILISFEEQLYLYFFGHSGAPSGYAAPNLSNHTDPNRGIRFEMIELTWNQYGLWTNTTRVDSYQNPMNLEVWGGEGFYKRVGELIVHDSVITQWKENSPTAFDACFDEEHEVIHAPSKTTVFQTGGSQEFYFKEYIDAIWEKYSKEDLIFYSGDAGTWKGRVEGEQFVFHNLTNSFGNATAYISRRPNTQEALEGKGVLAEDVQKLPNQTLDLVVQAQFCAALNRHSIDLDAPAGSTQDWSDSSKFFKVEPYNAYVKFWHNTKVSHEGFSYGFCYDDVFDYSSTIHTPSPDSVQITIGIPEEKTAMNHSTLITKVARQSITVQKSQLRFSYPIKTSATLKLLTTEGRLLEEFSLNKGTTSLQLQRQLPPTIVVWQLEESTHTSVGLMRSHP